MRSSTAVRFDRPGVELDPGGIGKGYAVDRMVDVLRENGVSSGLISAGSSSIYALGAPPGDRGLEGQDPRSREIPGRRWPKFI